MPVGAIELRAVTRRFGDVRALDELSISIPPGQVAGLLGHNGAGKTTTIRILNGVLAPSGGSVEVLGMDPVTDGHRIRARTGVLTETPAIDERLTAHENLAFAAQLFGVPSPAIAKRVAQLLERFDLAGRASERTAGFSRGMKQRLALARALVHDPELVFLDEPTAALDPVAARDVHELVRSYAREEGRTVVITTHNLVEAQRLCDRVVILRNGRPIADGTPADLARQLPATGRVEMEVGVGQAASAAELARGHVGGARVAIEGDSLHIEGLARDRLPHLVRELAAAGVSIYAVNPGEPTLEDAYFALHTEEPA